MRDLKSSKAMWVKATVFLLIAVASSTLLVIEMPTIRVAVLLAMAIWGSCRAYYFAFYVIEHYVDPSFKFSGLGSFAAYALRRRRSQK